MFAPKRSPNETRVSVGDSRGGDDAGGLVAIGGGFREVSAVEYERKW